MAGQKTKSRLVDCSTLNLNWGYEEKASIFSRTKASDS